MLDNSFGPWTEYYSQGPESTWVKSLSKSDYYVKYQGRKPISEKLNRAVNRVMISKPGTRIWKHLNLLIRGGLPSVTKVEEDVIEIDCFESWNNISRKTLAALDFCLANYKFDYIVRCNSTVYLMPDKLREHLSQVQSKFYYGGPSQISKQFISGWCVILSRDTASVVVDNYQKSDFGVFDDESIGQILRRNDIFPTKIKHEQIYNENDSLKIVQGHEETNFIWRVKDNKERQRISSWQMKNLHRWLSETKE